MNALWRAKILRIDLSWDAGAIVRMLVFFLVIGITTYAEEVRIEAESARVRSVGGEAANGSVWNLWTNGEIGDYVDVRTSNTLEVRVRAYGTLAAGQGPRLGISIDDVMKGHIYVTSTSPTFYTFSLAVPKGLHKIALTFDNDLYEDGEDRNLYIDWFVAGPDARLGDPTAWGRNWDADLSAADAATLTNARQAIESNRKGDCVVRIVDDRGRNIVNAPIELELQSHAFLFGCNIFGFDAFATERENALYKERFQALFNYATTGFYWRSYEQVKGKPDYARTDAIVAWCTERGITIKGHPLLWDHEAAMPRWANGQPDAQLQEARVREIVGRYKGKIDIWEVVNEPSHARGVRVDAPYRWAREANPSATLIINDYQVMADGYPPFFALLETAIKNEVPFDGVGIQAHEPRTMRFPLSRVKSTLDKYATLGKRLHITEFTPTSGGMAITGSTVAGVWDETSQAEYTEQFYTVCFAHPAVDAITWWDLCDAKSWLKGGGLLREDLSPKPAYNVLKRLIQEQWTTQQHDITDPEGACSFRGFFGTYLARVEVGEKTLRGTFTHTSGTNGPILVTVR